MATVITLDSRDTSQIAALAQSEAWVVACLCAAWCDVCTAYRPEFDLLAARQTDTVFVWIDIEDQADLMGDIDIENFPTILIQRADRVAFFGTMQPSISQLERMVRSLRAPADGHLQHEAEQEKPDLQRYNLRDKLLLSAKNI